MVNAVNFIDETKRDEESTEERIVPKLSDNEKKATQNRRIIKVLLWVIAILVVAMIGWIVFNIYQLEG